MEASADSCSSFTCRISPSHAARSAVASVMPAPPRSFDRTVLSSAATRAMGRATRGFEYTAPLETERLLLRAFEDRDVDAVFNLRSRPEGALYTYSEPQTEVQAREALEKRIGFRALRDEGDVLALASEMKTTGEVVGDVVIQWV